MPEKASIRPFPSVTLVGGSQGSSAQFCNSAVNIEGVTEAPPAAESTHLSTDEWKGKNLVPLEICEQEEYLNIQPQFISSTAEETAHSEIQQEQII